MKGEGGEGGVGRGEEEGVSSFRTVVPHMAISNPMLQTNT